MMGNKEAVKAILEGKPVDRIPVIHNIMTLSAGDTIDMNELNDLIDKLEELKEFYNQLGDLEKVKLASNLVQELTEGTNRDAWIPFAQSWVELYESRS